MTVSNLQLPVHSLIREPQLVFHPERSSDRHIHPLKGLVEFGPYSRSLIGNVLDPIRIALIVPFETKGVISHLLKELNGHHKPNERRSYLIEYPGFTRIFGLRIVPGPRDTWLQLPQQLDSKLKNGSKPHVILVESLTEAITSLQVKRSTFDVLLIYLPDKWANFFYGIEGEDFDLHDYIKATTATLGIPTQIILESKALAYPCRASVMWRLSIALYCKAGGVPWKLAESNPNTAFIGLSYALRPTEAGKPRFVTCCSQVFDSDGAGLEFLTYETDEIHIERDNPFLNRNEMRRVMARSLSLYQKRHAGRIPKRIVVHKSTEFKKEESDGCFDAFQALEEIDLLTVQSSVPWKGVHIDPPKENGHKGIAGGYPCLRGSYVPLGDREVLLWTQGDSPDAANGRHFYKEGKGIPSPIRLQRFAGHGSWDQECQEVLGLTKMDWNNDSLYNRQPVTLSYASVLARTIKRMPTLASRPYELRFFM